MIKFIKDGKKQHNKRRSIDIYFILYLTALVILIAGKDKDNYQVAEQQPHLNVEFPFRIKAEKPLLMCKILNDSLGQPVIILDSINYLLDYGDVSNIRYEFVVEDAELRHKINLSQTDHSAKMFSFVHDTANRIVVFRWYPEVYDLSNLSNKTFNIYVTASALPFGSIDTASQNRMQAKTQFSLMIIDERNTAGQNTFYNVALGDTQQSDMPQFGFNNQYQPIIIQQSDISMSAEFSLKPQVQTVRGIAGDSWENNIVCYGFLPARHLTRSPSVEIFNTPESNGGTIYSTDFGENSIILKGKIPDAGRSKVTLSVQRKGDLKEQKVSFELRPLSIDAAEVPRVMYPGVEYTINPNLPSELPEVAAYIRDKETVRFRSYNNHLIKFTPTQDDVGKTLSFERWLNTKLFGLRYSIKIIDYPAPEITGLSLQSKNVIILKTITYGMFGDHINSIKEIRLTGNAKSIPMYGKAHNNKAKLESREQFQIEPQDATKPFIFEAIAVDQLNRTSNIKSYK